MQYKEEVLHLLISAIYNLGVVVTSGAVISWLYYLSSSALVSMIGLVLMMGLKSSRFVRD